MIIPIWKKMKQRCHLLGMFNMNANWKVRLLMKKKHVFRRKDTIFEFFIEFEKDVKFPYFNLIVTNSNVTKYVCVYLTENTYRRYGIYQDNLTMDERKILCMLMEETGVYQDLVDEWNSFGLSDEFYGWDAYRKPDYSYIYQADTGDWETFDLCYPTGHLKCLNVDLTIVNRVAGVEPHFWLNQGRETMCCISLIAAKYIDYVAENCPSEDEYNRYTETPKIVLSQEDKQSLQEYMLEPHPEYGDKNVWQALLFEWCCEYGEETFEALMAKYEQPDYNSL